jgi:hypothetical protein
MENQFAPLVIYLGIVILIIKFLINVFREKKHKIRKRDKIQYAYHGLRCYSRGLNTGEKEVVKYLSSKLDIKKYYIFNNLTLKTKDGSTQIDHVVVSPYGIFVIETKDYSGWIFPFK